MLLVTTALSGLMAGAIQTAPTPAAPTPQEPAAQQPPAQDPAGPDPDIPTASEEEAEDAVDLGTVSVSSARPRGSVDTDIPPDLVLSAEEIMAYGASDIAELLTYLEPVTRSSSGRTDLQPVFLVNGRRTSGFREIRGIPTEAIERTEILPEAVAVQFGYRPEQRVVNFVLKADFRSTTYQLTGRVPTQGGRSTIEAEADLLRISGSNRWSMDLEYSRSTPLYESERNIRRDPGSQPFDLIGNVTGVPFGEDIDPALTGRDIVPVPGLTTTPTLADFVAAGGEARTGDLGAYRTLMSASEQAQVSGTIKRDLSSTTQATVSASLEDNSSRSFNGLPGVVLGLSDANPFSPFAEDALVYRYLDDAASLQRRTDRLQGELGVVVDGFLGDDWRWTATGEYTRTETDTVTGRGYERDGGPFQSRLDAGDPTANPFGPLDVAGFTPIANDTARSVSQRIDTELVLTGDVWELPAGDVSSTFKVGADSVSLDSVSTRNGVTTQRDQSRQRLNGQASLNIPIASRRNEVLTGLGDLSIGVDAGFEDLSDFGGLSKLGATVNWSPIEKLSFLASWTDEQGAPTISQLNDPVIETFNVPVFDFATGETVLVTQISGGNPDLNADDRQVVRIGGTFRPFEERDLSISSTWTWSRTNDYIASFPTITPDLEAALPDRFERDPDGNLVRVDARPLNFDRYERQDLRTGFNFSRAFGAPSAPAGGEGGRGRGPGGPGGAPMVMRVEGGGPAPAGARGGGGGAQIRMAGGGGRGGGMQPGQGRFHLSVYHTWRLQDEIVIADGLPVLDLLDGAATSGRGGSPRHEIQATGGVFRNGVGTFVMANWRDSTRVNGGTGPDLQFADQLTVNVNVFMDLNQRTSWVERFPWLEGSRIQLGIQNLFDSRPEVTAVGAETPLNYQPDFLDPEGRSVRLTFRKILF